MAHVGAGGPASHLQTKRAREPLADPEGILADDDHKAKALKAKQWDSKGSMTLELGSQPRELPRPTLLGPVLSRRFGGTSSSSSA